MFEMKANEGLDKASHYQSLHRQLASLLAGERDPIANAANTASLLFHSLPGVNWAGFYILRGGELVLGPFHGNPACVRIAVGKGVCGAAAMRRETVMVDDVRQFPGHIACDAATRSEIVLPLVHEGHLWGVLDIDSPECGRFDREDRRGLEALAALFVERSDR